MLAPVLAVVPLLPLVAAYDWFDINNQPSQPWQPGQTGHNACGTQDSQDSMCQTVMINTVEDFCLWAPPNPNSQIGDTEEEEVAWCTASGHGARLMPQGTITSAHMLRTPHYIQITGTGDFTKINVQAGDSGGELDPHGATGYGNPRGGLVYENGQQIQEWMSFISDSEFCIRVCPSSDPNAWQWCQHIYDVRGCAWVEPGNYGSGFDSCDGEGTDLPPGIYSVNGGMSTYYQSDNGPVPTAHPAGASSNCQAVGTVGGNGAVAAAAPTTTSTSSAPASSSTASSDSSSSVSSIPSSSWSASSSSSSAVSSTTTIPSSTVSSTVSSDSSASMKTVVSTASVVTLSSTLSPATSASSTSARTAAAAASANSKLSAATQVTASTGLAGLALSFVGGLVAFLA
ncbi:hypothetical protein JCM10212_004535 [Sporobolomyces blumeae]